MANTSRVVKIQLLNVKQSNISMLWTRLLQKMHCHLHDLSQFKCTHVMGRFLFSE